MSAFLSFEFMPNDIFESLLFGRFKEGKFKASAIKTVRIVDISPEAFQFIVDAISLKPVSPTDNIIASVVYAARKYFLLDLTNLCKEYIERVGQTSGKRYYGIASQLWNMASRNEVRKWCEDIMKTPNGRNYTRERSRDVLTLCEKDQQIAKSLFLTVLSSAIS